ncbi:MAG: GNAT family N-acetyltransferase [Anaerolineae bacterium]
MNIQIRNMTRADLPDADRIFCEAFESPGSRIADLTLYYEIQPEGRLIGFVDGAPVATVAAIDYGPFAYIGAMAVLKEWQRRGLGRAMMEYVLQWLDHKGCPVVVLDASPSGRPLYVQLGFETDEDSVQYRLEASVEVQGAHPAVRPMLSDDLPAVIAFDTPIFGANRGQVLSRLLRDLAGRALIAENAHGEITGYVFAKQQGLGPFASEGVEEAEQLLRAALGLPFQTAPTVRIPSTNLGGGALLTQYGFKPQRALPHMRCGGAGPVGDHTRLYGLVSYAIG